MVTLFFVDFSKAFVSIHRGKMEQIFLAYSLCKETLIAIMILYSIMKVKSPDGDTNFLDVVAGVLPGDTLAPYSVYNLPRLRTSNVDISNKRNCFYSKKGKKQTISRKNYIGRRLRWWHYASFKYPSRIPSA